MAVLKRLPIPTHMGSTNPIVWVWVGVHPLPCQVGMSPADTFHRKTHTHPTSAAKNWVPHLKQHGLPSQNVSHTAPNIFPCILGASRTVNIH